MRNLAFILSLLISFGIIFSSCNGSSDKNTQTTITKTDSTGKKVKVEVPLTRIAYVDIDTLQLKYKVFVSKKASFESRTKKIENELKSKTKSLENQMVSFQKKAQTGGMTQAEGEKLQKSLLAKQQNLQKLEKNLSEKLFKDQDAFNEKFRKDLEAAVAEYNKDGKYDFVMLNTEEGAYLYSNPKLDITMDIVEILNSKP